MGSRVENYCDGCGDAIGDATLQDAVQITSLDVQQIPRLIYLCTKMEIKDNPENTYEQSHPPIIKFKGCARKVLTKATLTTLYEDVDKFTGVEGDKPFPL